MHRQSISWRIILWMIIPPCYFMLINSKISIHPHDIFLEYVVTAWLALAVAFSLCHTWHILVCTNAPMYTWQRWGSLMLFTLHSPLKDTDLYQRWPALCVPPSSPPICHWVMERLLILLKGQQDKREMQRMLNTKPMAPDTPHPSLSALSSLFLPAIPPLNCRLSRSYLHIVELCLTPLLQTSCLDGF